MRWVDPVEVIARRIRAQRLVGAPYASPAEAVASLGAVQSQEYGAAKWSLAQRCGHQSDSEVERAIMAGEILRTHVLRPTWHFVTPDDIGWMLRLTAPRIRAKMRQACRDHELDDALLTRCTDLLTAALAGSVAMTRAELREELEGTGIEMSASRASFVASHLELEGLVASGPLRGGKQTYALLAERAPNGRDLEGEEALAELAGRYFASHGPATIPDFAWWSGLTLTAARRGLELCGDRLQPATDEESRTWYAEPAEWAEAAPEIEGALMLGSFDELTVAYKNLRTVSAAGEPGRVLPLAPILIGGRLVGNWKQKVAKDAVQIEATVFATLDLDAEAALEAESQRYGEHLGLPAELSIAPGEPVAAA